MKSLLMISVLLVTCVLNAAAQETDLGKGIESYYAGDYQESVDLLETALAAKVRDQDLLLYLGMAYSKLGNSKKAGEAFQKADEQRELKKVTKSMASFKLLSRPRASYTDLARRNNDQGTVKLAVEIGADGRVLDTFTFQTLPDGLTENVIEAAQKIKFERLHENQKVSGGIAIFYYEFTLY